MRPLFQKLLTQQKPEDFFTEIVAALFSKKENDLLRTWLIEELKLEGVHPQNDVKVKTQTYFSKLPGQSIDSRVDLVLSQVNPKGSVLVFIESKIGSGAEATQIERYAEHLSMCEDYAHKYLLFITRDYVPGNKQCWYEKTAKDKDRKIEFKAVRWFRLYQHLQTYKKDSFIVTETRKFMEAYGMNQKATFDKNDVHALTNLQSAIGLMEETLSSKVRDEFEKIIGAVNQSPKSSLSQVIDNNRYVIYGWFQERWWCLAGYQLDGPDERDHPRVTVALEVHPNSNRVEEIAGILLSISEQNTEWEFYEADGWQGISHSKPLTDLLAGADHVSEIIEFFLESLKKIENFKKVHTDLPWQSTGDSTEQS